jgi:hypothetical protein
VQILAGYKSFDDVYTVFMDSTLVDGYLSPRTPEGMYGLLEHALRRYRLAFDSAKQVEFIRDVEMLTVELDDNDVELIVAYMALKTYEKGLTEFTSTYDVMMDDIGRRNFKAQSDARLALVEEQKRKIARLILKMSEDFDVIDEIS